MKKITFIFPKNELFKFFKYKYTFRFKLSPSNMKNIVVACDV